MAQVTNQQLQEMLQRLISRMDRNEERINANEEQIVILKRIEITVNSYEQVIKTLTKLLKYVLGVISVSAASILAYWVMGLLHIHLTP